MFDFFKKKIKETFDKTFNKPAKENITKSIPEPEKESIEENPTENPEESPKEHIKEPEQETATDQLENPNEQANKSTAKSIRKTFTETLLSVKKKAVEKEITQKELDAFFYDIELVLLENNASYDATDRIIENAKKELLGTKADRFNIKEALESSIKNSIFDILNQEKIDMQKRIKEANEKGGPCVIVFLGFNGAGKTTNLAKMGYLLQKQGLKCVFAAADTFRAAAIEQLKTHADKLKIPVVSHQYGADSAAVIFDAKKYAAAHKIDVVLCDTAGRVHTDKNLMEELKKIKRVNHPHLMILVAESITGSDIENQVEQFSEVGIDGTILTKTDIDGKIGSAISVCYLSKRPILYLSCGQKYEDLDEFDAKSVLDSVFEK